MSTSCDRPDEFVTALEKVPDLPVTFAYREHRSRAGYHVTEVRHASVTAIDCGRVRESWDELLVELLDGDALPGGGRLSASKLRGILAGAIEALGSDRRARLFVEFGPRNADVRKLVVSAVDVAGDEIVVTLGDTRARCKPARRAVRAVVERAGACCGERADRVADRAPETRRRCCA